MAQLRKLLAVLFLIGGSSQGYAQMTETEIRNGYKEHAAKAQFYRWFQIYERPEGGIGNALNILSPDVRVTSSLGTANGHEEYSARVQQLPETWQNSHRVITSKVTQGADGTLNLDATILYQNLGMLEDGATRQAELSYAVTLAPQQDSLPLLKSVEITPVKEVPGEDYIDAYPENRMRSLVHAWLTLIEDPARNPEPVRELLADGFSLNLSSGAITDFEGFKAWLAGPASQVAASTHLLDNFSVSETGEGLYEVKADFDWAGLLPDGTELVAKTRHAWTVTNDVSERFARIKTMNVEILEPFRPRQK